MITFLLIAFWSLAVLRWIQTAVDRGGDAWQLIENMCWGIMIGTGIATLVHVLWFLFWGVEVMA